VLAEYRVDLVKAVHWHGRILPTGQR
jgi:hypothetical protein